jgi:hypothetical protein
MGGDISQVSANCAHQVPEMPHAGKHLGDAVLIGGLDNLAH